ncbi:protein F43G9.7, partial [Aphelenchoides avenae]
WYDADQRINERYEALEDQLIECVRAAEIRRKKDREPRINAETGDMLQRLQLLKQNGKDPEECRRLSHEIRIKLKADYADYRNRRLVEAAEHRASLKKCKRRMAQTQLITGALRDDEGQLQTERPAVEEVCRKFYTELFDSKVHVERHLRNAAEEEEAILDPVTGTEIEEALKRFKNEKAPGPDGITAEMLKAGGERLWDQLAKFFTTCMRMKRIPLKWKESRTVLLYKKGDPNDVKNYRPICLLPVIYKLFTKERILHAGPHAGGQSDPGTREKDMRLYLVFVDYEKAFDSVEINAVLNALVSQGVSSHYVDILEDVYDGCTTEVKLFHDTVTIPIKRGVRQGDTMSPKLFTAAFEEVIRTLGWERRRQCGLSINGRKLTHLRFADDNHQQQERGGAHA